MKRYVTRVIALDGWQYSIGCVVEFYHATECDILIESFSGEILNAENARILIHDAADDIESRGASFKLLQRMAQTLRSYNLINGAIGV